MSEGQPLSLLEKVTIMEQVAEDSSTPIKTMSCIAM
jgi:hypothetical protein